MTLNSNGTISKVQSIDYGSGRLKFDRKGDLLMLNSNFGIRKYSKNGELLKTYDMTNPSIYQLFDFVVDANDNITAVGWINSSP